jgi:hypothetical protein
MDPHINKGSGLVAGYAGCTEALEQHPPAALPANAR